MEFNFFFIGSAFVAGLITFLAPCTFPLLPAYLAVIAGGTLDQTEDKQLLRRNVFFNGLLYVIGFSLIFISLGLFAGFVGNIFPGFRLWFTRLGGIFVIIFGLYMLGVFKIPLFNKTKKMKLPETFEAGKPVSAFLLGVSVAFGWTPCVGPILGSILILAANSSTAWQGAILLVVFSLGLAIPFLLFAIAIGSATKYVQKISKHSGTISKIGGVLLIALGMLLLFNQFGLLIGYGFRLLDFLGYDGILQYL